MHTLAVILSFLSAIGLVFITAAIIVANPSGDLLLSALLISLASFGGSLTAMTLGERE